MKLYKDSQFSFPGVQIPSFCSSYAIQEGVQNKILFKTPGGIGDQICAEPTIRFAIDNFKDVEISLATRIPDLLGHLKVKEVFNINDNVDYDKYFVLHTYVNNQWLIWDFVSHGLTHCVDFPSICALQGTIPIDYKAIQLPVELDDASHLIEYTKSKYVGVHASKNWESSTYPVEWWDSILKGLIRNGFVPVLFGKEINETQGTVQTLTEGCVDLRNKLSLKESTWLLQRMKSVVCNDSSPYHMAASGNAFIALIITAKHHDFLLHWRRDLSGKVQWAWRTKAFNKGGMWDLTDRCPNKAESFKTDRVDINILKTWLPEPSEIVSWVKGVVK